MEQEGEVLERQLREARGAVDGALEDQALLLLEAEICSMVGSLADVVTKRVATTFFAWPMRCARWIACISTAGFHHGSSRYTRDASCRFKPSPPALSESKIAAIDASLLKRARTLLRSARGMSPVSLTTRCPPNLNRHSMRSSIVLY